MEPITIIIGCSFSSGRMCNFFFIKKFFKRVIVFWKITRRSGKNKEGQNLTSFKEKFIELKSQHERSINEKNREFNKSPI